MSNGENGRKIHARKPNGSEMREATPKSRRSPSTEKKTKAAVAQPEKNGNAAARNNEISPRLKWQVLAFLVLQNSSASLVMRHSKAREGAAPWDSQVAVLAQEAIKTLVCIVLLLKDGTLNSVFSNKTEVLKTAIPALLYLLQNNLQYVAVTYLDASTYAVMYQLKILTTALISILLLGKRLSPAQWLSLVFLTVGVSTVVVSQIQAKSANPKDRMLVLKGVAAVLASCFLSGLAGVSFEKLLKGSTISLWARNLQLAMYSGLVGTIGLVWSREGLSMDRDYFQGFSIWVWASIINNALGGLLIAMVIKYADNILKNFSTSLSIILTATVSVLCLGTPVNAEFVLGTGLVLYAVFLYGGVGVPAFLSDNGAAGRIHTLMHVFTRLGPWDAKVAPKKA